MKTILKVLVAVILSSITTAVLLTGCSGSPTQPPVNTPVPTTVPTVTTPIVPGTPTPTVTTTATPTVTATVTTTATVTATVTATPRSIYYFGTGDYSPAIMDWNVYLDTVSAGNLVDGGANGLPFNNTGGSFVPQSGHSYIMVFQYDPYYPPSGSDVLTAGFKYANDNSVAASGTAVGPASATVTLVVP